MTSIAPHLAALSALIAQDAEAGQVNTRQLQLLALLSSETEPMTIVAAATRLGVSQSRMSRVASALVDKGLVTSTEDRYCRRAVLLRPTRIGRDLDSRVRGYVATVNLIPGDALQPQQRT
jgi:DNA-binding MarR family transcriptional regulator